MTSQTSYCTLFWLSEGRIENAQAMSIRPLSPTEDIKMNVWMLPTPVTLSLYTHTCNENIGRSDIRKMKKTYSSSDSSIILWMPSQIFLDTEGKGQQVSAATDILKIPAPKSWTV